MTLKTIKLAGSQVLVEGTDVRGYTDSEVLDSSEWDSYKLHTTHKAALSKVDEAIADLIAPITKAAREAQQQLKAPTFDPLFFVVEQEAVESVVGRHEVIVPLSRDSVILRAIEEGLHSRLIWVNGSLVVTEEAQSYTVPTEVTPVDLSDVASEASGDVVSE